MYSVTVVKSEGSTPYASATRDSKRLISDASSCPVVVEEISMETTSPMKEGAEVGGEINGDEVGTKVGLAVINASQE